MAHQQPVRRITRHLAVLVAMLTACAPGLVTGELQGVAIENPAERPSFTLTDTSGEPYEFAAATEGKLTLLYFGYLNCPDICPVHLAQIAEVFERIPNVARDTEVVFVSVDPGRDSPQDIREFLDNFDHRFVGLTGTEDELVRAQSAAGVPPAVIVENGDDYTVDHAGWVIAYGPDGLNHAIYPFGTRQSQWDNDLQILAGMD
ncbi:MAG TPA: SCO family protein [Acidimicrobiia bacterium]|nr:SCO family protein [Acidimicrobiia bacterium]